MVRAISLAVLAALLVGCGSGDKTSQTAPNSVDQQTQNLENRTDIPDDVKAQAIEQMRQQQAGKQGNAGS